MANNIGPKIGVEGEAEYRRQMGRIIQQTKELDSEMRTVTSSFDKNTTQQEKNAAAGEILTRKIEARKKAVELIRAQYEKAEGKLELYRRKLEEATAAHGVNSKEVKAAQRDFDEYEKKVSQTEIALNNTTAQLNKLTHELNHVGDEMDEGAEKALDFGDVLKANLLSDAIMDGIQELGGYVKDLFAGSIDAAATMKAEVSQFEQTFGEFGEEASDAIERVADYSGILDTRMRSAASSIYAFARSSGGGAKESLDMMEEALMAAADGAAYYDKSLDDTVETLQSFLKGNFANDAALGVSCTETTRNAKAMELFKKEYKELSEIQKQKTLLKMVTDAQKLSGAMGQAGREADGWENVQGNLNEAVRQFQAELGKPVLENSIPIIKRATAEFTKWQKSVNWTQFGRQVTSVFDYLLDNGEEIIAVGGRITGALVGMKAVSGTVTVFKQLYTSTQSLVSVLSMQNGLGWALLAVGGVAATFIALTTDHTSASYQAAKADQERARSMEFLKDTYEAVRDAADAKAQTELAEIANTRRLYDELLTLVDANGKVAAANRDRATFILQELNKALGTEYTLTGDQIKQYQNLQKEVANTIRMKEAEILLTQYEERYTEAVKQRAEVESKYYEQFQRYQELEQIYKRNSAELTEWVAKNGIQWNNQEYQNLQTKVGLSKKAMEEAEDAYLSYGEQVEQVLSDIGLYQQAETLMLKGETDKVIALLKEQEYGFISAGSVTAQSAQEQVAALQSQYNQALFLLEDYRKKHGEGVRGYTAEGLQELQSYAEKCKQELDKATKNIGSGTTKLLDSYTSTLGKELDDAAGEAYRKGKKIGEDIISGTLYGLNRKESTLDERTKGIFSGMLKTAQDTLDIHSPSRKFQWLAEMSVTGFDDEFRAGMEDSFAEVRALLQRETTNLSHAASYINQHTSTSNYYGGSTIQVYAAPGQSAEDIAQAVMDAIQNEVYKRKAVFG